MTMTLKKSCHFAYTQKMHSIFILQVGIKRWNTRGNIFFFQIVISYINFSEWNLSLVLGSLASQVGLDAGSDDRP